MSIVITLYLCLTLLAFIVGGVVGYLKEERLNDYVVIYALEGALSPFLLLIAIPIGIAKLILFIKKRSDR